MNDLDHVAQVPDAETAVLGAVLAGVTGPEGMDGLLSRLKPEDFYRPVHEEVWAAIGRVHNSGGRPDPVSVRLALEPRHHNVLIDLMSEGAFVVDPTWHAERIATAAGLRRLNAAAVRIASMATPDRDLAEVREMARATLDEACRGDEATKARTIADLLPETLDAAQNGSTAVLATGWPDIDRSIGGLAPGRLVVVGARPGGGKSLAGTNLALQFAHKHKHAVLLVSLEMPEREVMNRLLSSHAQVNLSDLESGTVDEASWERLARKANELEAMPIHIVDDAGLSVQGVRRHARDVQRKRDDLALIVVDYLQLLTSDADQRKRGGNRAEEVSALARGLKTLARETGACVVAMAQVNREGAKNDDGPKLTDLREGGIENDADQVILFHRPDLDQADIRVSVAKNRHGPQGHSSLKLIGHYAQLANVSWTPTSALNGAAR